MIMERKLTKTSSSPVVLGLGRRRTKRRGVVTGVGRSLSVFAISIMDYIYDTDTSSTDAEP